MLPSLALRPACAAELCAIVLCILMGATALSVQRFSARQHLRHAALFTTYLSSALALVFAAHALTGRTPIVVSPYAATLVVGVLASWMLAAPRLRAVGLPFKLVFFILFGCLVLGLAGSRVANVLADLPSAHSSANFGRLADRGAGLGVFGAIVLDSLFLVALFRRYPEPSLARMLDGAASIIAFNMGVGRFGCLLAGCCYGAVARPGPFTLSASAFQFDSPAGLAYRGTPGAVIWATQPIESAALFAIALGCEILYRRRAQLRLREGAVIAVGAAAYGAVRAAMEIIRADSPRLVAGQMTVWQALGSALAVTAATWLALKGPRVATS